MKQKVVRSPLFQIHYHYGKDAAILFKIGAEGWRATLASWIAKGATWTFHLETQSPRGHSVAVVKINETHWESSDRLLRATLVENSTPPRAVEVKESEEERLEQEGERGHRDSDSKGKEVTHGI